MLEQGLSYLLRSFLGEFVEGGSSLNEKVSIGVWSGCIVLEHLELKKTLLDALYLPISLAHGFIGRLEIKIPWGSIGVDPVVILLDRVHLLFEPKYDWDADRRDSREQAIKQGKLAAAELFATQHYNERFSNKSTTFQKYRDVARKWFLESVLSKIVNNIQVTIRDVHIRYEDVLSCPTNFSVGIAFESLIIETGGTESFFNEEDNMNESRDKFKLSKWINKVIQILQLCIYWNPIASNSRLNSMKLNGISNDELQSYMSKSIPRGNLQSIDQPNHHYILHPVAISIYISIIPVAPITSRISFIVPRIAMTLEDRQYREILYLSTNMANFMQLEKYCLFRPSSSVLENPSAWWRYAIHVILHQLRSSMRYNFSSKRFNQRISDKLVYIELWKSRMLIPEGKKTSELPLEQMRSTEFRSSKLYKRLRKISRDRRLQSRLKSPLKTSLDVDTANKKQKFKSTGEGDTYHAVSALKPLTLESACLLANMEFHLSFEDILYFRSLAELDMSFDANAPSWMGSMFSWASGSRLGSTSTEDDKRKLFDALKHNPDDMFMSTNSLSKQQSNSSVKNDHQTIITASISIEQISFVLALSYPYSDIDTSDSLNLGIKYLPFLELNVALAKFHSSFFNDDRFKFVVSVQDVEAYDISPQQGVSNANGSAVRYCKLLSRRRDGSFKQISQSLKSNSKLFSRYPIVNEDDFSSISSKRIFRTTESPLFSITIEFQSKSDVIIDVVLEDMLLSMSPLDKWVKSVVLFAKIPDDLDDFSDVETNDLQDIMIGLNSHLEHICQSLTNTHINALINARIRTPMLAIYSGGPENENFESYRPLEVIVIDSGLIELKTVSLASSNIMDDEASASANIFNDYQQPDSNPNDSAILSVQYDISEAVTPTRNFTKNLGTMSLPTHLSEFANVEVSQDERNNFSMPSVNDRNNEGSDNKSTTTMTAEPHFAGQESMFDVFSLKISGAEIYLTQIDLSLNGIENESYKEIDKKNIIVERFNVEAAIELCARSHSNLPPIKLTVFLSEVSVHLSDAKTIEIIRLLNKAVVNTQYLQVNELQNSKFKSKHMKSEGEIGDASIGRNGVDNDDVQYFDAVAGNQSFFIPTGPQSIRKRKKPSTEFLEKLSIARPQVDQSTFQTIRFDNYSNPGVASAYDLANLDISEVESNRSSTCISNENDLSDDSSSIRSFISASAGATELIVENGESLGIKTDIQNQHPRQPDSEYQSLSLAVGDFQQLIQRHENLRLNLLSSIRLAESDPSTKLAVQRLRNELDQMNEKLRQLKAKYVEALIASDDQQLRYMNSRHTVENVDAFEYRDEIVLLENRLHNNGFRDAVSSNSDKRDNEKKLLRSALFHTHSPNRLIQRLRPRTVRGRELLSIKFTILKVNVEFTIESLKAYQSHSDYYPVDEIKLMFTVKGCTFKTRHKVSETSVSLALHDVFLCANLSTDSKSSLLSLISSDPEDSPNCVSPFFSNGLASSRHTILPHSHVFQFKYRFIYHDDPMKFSGDKLDSLSCGKHNFRVVVGFVGLNIDFYSVFKIASATLISISDFCDEMNLMQSEQIDKSSNQSTENLRESTRISDIYRNLNIVIACRINCVALSLMKTSVPLSSFTIRSTTLNVHHSDLSTNISCRISDMSLFYGPTNSRWRNLFFRESGAHHPFIAVSLRTKISNAIPQSQVDIKLAGDVIFSPVELVITPYFVDLLILQLDFPIVQRDIQNLINAYDCYCSKMSSNEISVDYFSELHLSGDLSVNIGSVKLRVESDDMINMNGNVFCREISLCVDGISLQITSETRKSILERFCIIISCEGIRANLNNLSIIDTFNVYVMAIAKTRELDQSSDQIMSNTLNCFSEIHGLNKLSVDPETAEGLVSGQIYFGAAISPICVHVGTTLYQQIDAIFRAYRLAMDTFAARSSLGSSNGSTNSCESIPNHLSTNLILSVKLSEISLKLDGYSLDIEDDVVRNDLLFQIKLIGVNIDAQYRNMSTSEPTELTDSTAFNEKNEGESLGLGLSILSACCQYRPDQTDSLKILYIHSESTACVIMSSTLKDRELNCNLLLSNIMIVFLPSVIIDVVENLNLVSPGISDESVVDLPFRSSNGFSPNGSFDHSKLLHDHLTRRNIPLGRSIISPIAAKQSNNTSNEYNCQKSRMYNLYALNTRAFSLPFFKSINLEAHLCGSQILAPSSMAYDYVVNAVVAGDVNLMFYLSSVAPDTLPIVEDSSADNDNSNISMMRIVFDIKGVRMSLNAVDNSMETSKIFFEPVDLIEPFDIRVAYNLGMGYKFIKDDEPGYLQLFIRQNVIISIDNIFVNLFTDISPLWLIYEQSINPIIIYCSNLSLLPEPHVIRESSDHSFFVSTASRSEIDVENIVDSIEANIDSIYQLLLLLLTSCGISIQVKVKAINISLLDNLDHSFSMPLFKSLFSIETDIFVPSIVRIFHPDSLGDEFNLRSMNLIEALMNLIVKGSSAFNFQYYNRILSSWEPLVEAFNVLFEASLPIPGQPSISFLGNIHSENSRQLAQLNIADSDCSKRISIEIRDVVNVNITFQLLTSIISCLKIVESLMIETAQRSKSLVNGVESVEPKKCYECIRRTSSKIRFNNESGMVILLSSNSQETTEYIPSSSTIALERIISTSSLLNSFNHVAWMEKSMIYKSCDIEISFPHDLEDSCLRIRDFQIIGKLEIFACHVIETAATSSDSYLEYGKWERFSIDEMKKLFGFLQERPSFRNLTLKSLLHPRVNYSIILVVEKFKRGDTSAMVQLRSTLRVHNKLSYPIRISLGNGISSTNSRYHDKWFANIGSLESSAVPPITCAKSVFFGLSLNSSVDESENSSKYATPVPHFNIEKEIDVNVNRHTDLAADEIADTMSRLQEQLKSQSTWLESESLRSFNQHRLRQVIDPLASNLDQAENTRYVHWIYLPNDHSVMAIYNIHDLPKSTDSLHRMKESTYSDSSKPILLRELTIHAPIQITNALGYAIEFSLGSSSIHGYIDSGGCVDITKYHPLQSVSLMVRFHDTNKSNYWSSICEISSCGFQVNALYELHIEIKYPNNSSLCVRVEVKEDSYGVRSITLYVPFWISTIIGTNPSASPYTISYQHADDGLFNGTDGLCADQVYGVPLQHDRSMTPSTTSSPSSRSKYRPRGIGVGKLNHPKLVLGPEVPVLGLKDMITESQSLTDLKIVSDNTSPRQQFIMCCFSTANKTCQLRLRQDFVLSGTSSNWSKPFSLDSSLSCSRIVDNVIKDPVTALDYDYSYGIVINSCSMYPFHRTQVISVFDQYVIQNRTNYELEFRQGHLSTDILKLSTNCEIPLRWQSNLPHLLQVRMALFGMIWSGTFSLEEEEITLRLKNDMDNKVYFLLITVEHSGPRLLVSCQDATMTNISLPYEIMNHTVEIYRIRQRNQPISTATLIAPYHSCDYAWDEPLASKVLCVDVAVGQQWRSVGEYSWDTGSNITEQSFTRTTPRGHKIRILLFSKGPVRVLDIRDLSVGTELTSPNKSVARSRDNLGLELLVHVRGIGLSIIDHTPEELIYTCVEYISVNINQVGSKIHTVDFTIKNFQIDGQLLLTPYPCILYPLQTNMAFGTLYSVPFLRCHLEHDSTYLGINYFPRLMIDLQAFDLNIDGIVIARLISFVKAVQAISLQPTIRRSLQSTSSREVIHQMNMNLLHSTSSSTIQKLFLREFIVSVIKFNVSLNPIGVNLSSNSQRLEALQAASYYLDLFSSSQLQPSEWLIASALKSVLIALATSLAKIENSNLKFSSFSCFNFFGSISGIQQLLAKHYLHQSIFQGIVLLASSQATGNIAQFLSTLQEGLSDFLFLPFAGLQISPIAFGFGLYRGTLSLISRSIASILSSAGQFLSSLQVGLLTLGAVDVHLPQTIRRPRNAYDGIILGFYGLIHEPSLLMEKEGLRGFVKGFSISIFGLFTRPLYGALVSLALFFERASLRLLPRLEYEQKYRLNRIRPPRFFSGPNTPLQAYSAQENIGRELLSRVDHGAYVAEQYMWYSELLEEKKNISVSEIFPDVDTAVKSFVLLTGKRILVVTSNSGNHQQGFQYRLAWQCLLSQLVSIRVDRLVNPLDNEVNILNFYYLPDQSQNKRIVNKSTTSRKSEWPVSITGLYLNHKSITPPSPSLTYHLTKLLTERVKFLLDDDIRSYLENNERESSASNEISKYRVQPLSEVTSGNEVTMLPFLGNRIGSSAIAMPKPREFSDVER